MARRTNAGTGTQPVTDSKKSITTKGFTYDETHLTPQEQIAAFRRRQQLDVTRWTSSSSSFSPSSSSSSAMAAAGDKNVPSGLASSRVVELNSSSSSNGSSGEDVNDGHHHLEEEEGEEEEDEGEVDHKAMNRALLASEEPWTNREGDRLRDFGVDEEEET